MNGYHFGDACFAGWACWAYCAWLCLVFLVYLTQLFPCNETRDAIVLLASLTWSWT